MNEKRYIADLHFFDEDVRMFMDKRPFASADEMNEHITSQWNDTVQKGDEVIVLGDMFSRKGRSAYDLNRVLHRLKGKIALVTGNHDTDWIRKPDVDIGRFSWIAEQKTVRDKGREVLLNHYPILFFGKNHVRDEEGRLKKYMLHGHVHDSPEAQLLYRFMREAAETSFVTAKGTTEPMVCNCINCFCGYSDYRPLTLDEWARLAAEKSTAGKENYRWI